MSIWRHPDFRIRKKMIATIAHDETWGMVKLTPGQQKSFQFVEPNVFQAIPGAWGKPGCKQ